MIRALFAVVEKPGELRRTFVGMAVTVVLQGGGFVLLVPLLRKLIESDTGTAAWWLLALAAGLLVFALVRHTSQLRAYHAAIDIGRSLFARLGDKVARLPLGWFDTERVGSLGRITGQGVIDVIGVPAHLLRPLINAFVTPVVVLDEATAAIDPANELAVQNAIDTLRGSRTLIVIARRLSTIAAADEILVLDAGRIAERGTHDDLLRTDGRYASFWRQRARAAGWRLARPGTA